MSQHAAEWCARHRRMAERKSFDANPPPHAPRTPNALGPVERLVLIGIALGGERPGVHEVWEGRAAIVAL
jgi:hypothetical protein